MNGQIFDYPGFQRIFFLIDTDGQRGAKRRKEKITSRERYQTVSTVYFILGILGTDLWSQGNIFLVVWYVFEPVGGRKNASKEYNICAY